MSDLGPDRRGGFALVVAVVVGGLASIAALAFAVMLLTRPTAGVQIQDPAVGATISDTAALYFTVRNATDQPDLLERVGCACAQSAVLHRGEITDDGAVDMSSAMAIEIQPGESVDFGPGGNHVMLEGLTSELKEGDSVSVEVTFAIAGTQHVSVPVVSLTALADRAADQLASDDGS